MAKLALDKWPPASYLYGRYDATPCYKVMPKLCIFPNCTNEQYFAWLCNGHYKMKKRTGKLEPLRDYTKPLEKKASPVVDKEKTGTCLGPLCNRKVVAQNLCSTHYRQFTRGEELKPLRLRENAEDRFWRYVNKDTESGCWEWTQSKTDQGYGQFIVAANNRVLTHRYAYELVHGIKLESNQILDHLCRNRACCNPEHLEIVSLRENTKRMLAYKMLKDEISRLRLLLIDNEIYPGLSIFNIPKNFTKDYTTNPQ